MRHEETPYILTIEVDSMGKTNRKRLAIINVLRNANEPMTAQQIFDKMSMKYSINDARHISVIIRGMKNIKKGVCTAYSLNNQYPVNTYIYDDDGAEI